MFHLIPTELLDDIFQYLPNQDLLSLSQTSSLCYPIAQRILYRYLLISPVAHNLPVLSTLAQRPDLAAYVRTFSITIDSDYPLCQSFCHDLALALSHMSDLTYLGVFLDPTHSWVLGETQSVVFSRLQRFVSTFQFDKHLASFLGNTPALLELELDSLPESDPLPSLSPKSIPLLNQFTGSPQAAKIIVSGRPVESIHLTAGDLTTDIVRSFANATANIIFLGATTSSLPISLLESLAQHLPHLVYLRLTTTYLFTEAPENAFYEGVANALNSLSDLTAFELSGMHWGSYKTPHDGDKRVWQSAPLSASTAYENDDDLYSDVFFVY